MNRDASKSSSSLEIARGMLAREAGAGRARDSETAGAALQGLCLRVEENLRDAMGMDGCNALLVRALARTEADHPALKKVTRIDGNNIHLDGVAASVEAHGIAAVTAALEALLAALIDSLGRLIGEDMAIRLMNHDDPLPRRRGATEAP